MRTRRSYSRPVFTPAKVSGHLYYVRLNTDFGPLYKLGFTTMPSVSARLGFKGNGDELLIDEVLLFAYHDQAFTVEQALHSHFARYRAFGPGNSGSAYPLFLNGQSELFGTDVLKLDPSYTAEQGAETLKKLPRPRAGGTSILDWKIKAAVAPFIVLIYFIRIFLVTCEWFYDAIARTPRAKRGSTFGKSTPTATVASSGAVEQFNAHQIDDWLRWVGENKTRATPFEVDESRHQRKQRLLAQEALVLSQSISAGSETATAKTDSPSINVRSLPAAPETCEAVPPAVTDQRVGLVAMLKNARSEDACHFLALSQPLDSALIGLHVENWNWKRLSQNETLTWSEALIADYSENWDWDWLSVNAALCWSDELIERYNDRWCWLGLSRTTSLPWSDQLIDRFKDRWQWESCSGYVGNMEGLSENTGVPWTSELLTRFSHYISWEGLSSNQFLPWSPELIEQFKDKWSWKNLSGNPALPWSFQLIKRYANEWCWVLLYENSGQAYSLTLIELESCRDQWDRDGRCAWQHLASNPSLPWTIELLDRHRGSLDAAGEAAWANLSGNTGVPWTVEIIDRFQDQLSFSGQYMQGLSGNTALRWSPQLISRFQERWNWAALASNESIPWSLDLIERYQEHWDWDRLSNNKSLPWSLELLSQYRDKWNWTTVSRNHSIPLTQEIMEAFSEHWSWPDIASRKGRNVPTLSRDDIIEIMDHHYRS